MIMYNITSKTALIVIDTQNEYFSEDGNLYTENAKRCTSNINKLINMFRSNNMEIIYVKHMHKRDGSNVGRMGDFDATPIFIEGSNGAKIYEEISVTTEDTIIYKDRYSSFVGTGLHELLRSKGIDTVVITGLMTNFCCLSTAFSASDMDYKTIMVIDAVEGPDLPDLGYGSISQDTIKKVVASTLLFGVAEVADTETLLNRG